MGRGLRLTRVFGGVAILIGIGLVGSFFVAGRIRGSDQARQKFEQRFDEFDADGDGRLTEGELPQRRLFDAVIARGWGDDGTQALYRLYTHSGGSQS